MQCSSLQLPAAVLACCRDGLDLGVLPPVTIFGHTGIQQVVSGGILASENHPWTETSALLLKECKYPQICAKFLSSVYSVRKREVFQSRHCLLHVVENGAEHISNFLCTSLQSRNPAFAVASKTPCHWTHWRRSCLSHLKIGNTDHTICAVKYSALLCRTCKVLF